MELLMVVGTSMNRNKCGESLSPENESSDILAAGKNEYGTPTNKTPNTISRITSKEDLHTTFLHMCPRGGF